MSKKERRALETDIIEAPAGYDTTVGELMSSREALVASNLELEHACAERLIQCEQLSAVLEAIQLYVPKHSTVYLLAAAALHGAPVAKKG